MSEHDDKLKRGFTLLTQADGDDDLLGVALLAIHGALEDHLRATLAEIPELSPEERQAIERREIGWLTLVNLAQQHARLRPEYRRVILEANERRQAFAHGEPFQGQVEWLLRYGRLVEAICERRGMLDRMLLAQRAQVSARERDARAYNQPVPQRRARQPAWVAPVRSLLIIAIVAGMLFIAGRMVYTRLQVDRLVSALGGPSATIGPRPTLLVPSPTPTRRARIIQLGDATGWLHEQPNFSSGTLPTPLREGMRVTMLDQQQTDAEGVVWQYVSINGYEGWCPADNLAVDS